MAVGEQPARQMKADEAGAAGHKKAHGGILSPGLIARS
jgi:hypothetical protein